MLPVYALLAYGFGMLTTLFLSPKCIRRDNYSKFKSTITSSPRLKITAPVSTAVPFASTAVPFTSASVAATRSQNVFESYGWGSLAGLGVLTIALIGISGFLYYLRVRRVVQLRCTQDDDTSIIVYHQGDAQLQDIIRQYDWDQKKLDNFKLDTYSTSTNHQEALDSVKLDDQHDPQKALVIYKQRQVAQLDHEKSRLHDKPIVEHLKSRIKTQMQLTASLEKTLSSQHIKINELKPQLETQTQLNAEVSRQQLLDKDTIMRLESQIKYQKLEKDALERDVKIRGKQTTDQQREITRLKNSLEVSKAEMIQAIEKKEEVVEAKKVVDEFWRARLGVLTRENEGLKKEANERTELLGWQHERLLEQDAKIMQESDHNLMAESNGSPIDNQHETDKDTSVIIPGEGKNAYRNRRRKIVRAEKRGDIPVCITCQQPLKTVATGLNLTSVDATSDNPKREEQKDMEGAHGKSSQEHTDEGEEIVEVNEAGDGIGKGSGEKQGTGKKSKKKGKKGKKGGEGPLPEQ